MPQIASGIACLFVFNREVAVAVDVPVADVQREPAPSLITLRDVAETLGARLYLRRTR